MWVRNGLVFPIFSIKHSATSLLRAFAYTLYINRTAPDRHTGAIYNIVRPFVGFWFGPLVLVTLGKYIG